MAIWQVNYECGVAYNGLQNELPKGTHLNILRSYINRSNLPAHDFCPTIWVCGVEQADRTSKVYELPESIVRNFAKYKKP